jgi:hypothetical protein
MVETIVASLAAAMRRRTRKDARAYSLEEPLVAGALVGAELDGAGDVEAEAPSDAGELLGSVAAFLSAGVDSAEELPLFDA